MRSDVEARRIEPSAIYWGGATIGALVMANFAWDSWRSFSLESLFFCLIGFGLAVWSLNALATRVFLHATGLCVSRPLRRPHCVEFRQLVTVAEEGRINPVITLVYHPALANGLLDLDAAASIELPAVQAQAELLALLQAKTP